MRLKDFAECAQSKQAGLTLLHVAALRIYTTAAFIDINGPLRDISRRECGVAHPLPVTCSLIDRAVGKLRAVDAYGPNANKSLALWRGLKNVAVPEEFLERGGTELAPISTTSDLTIAIRYGTVGSSCVLLKLLTRSSMERGADIAFLSAFPRESECLFKPLTFLQPVGRPKEITLAGRAVTVIEVEPRV